MARALGRRAFFTTGFGSVAKAVASVERSIDATVERGSEASVTGAFDGDGLRSEDFNSADFNSAGFNSVGLGSTGSRILLPDTLMSGVWTSGPLASSTGASGFAGASMVTCAFRGTTCPVTGALAVASSASLTALPLSGVAVSAGFVSCASAGMA